MLPVRGRPVRHFRARRLLNNRDPGRIVASQARAMSEPKRQHENGLKLATLDGQCPK